MRFFFTRLRSFLVVNIHRNNFLVSAETFFDWIKKSKIRFWASMRHKMARQNTATQPSLQGDYY